MSDRGYVLRFEDSRQKYCTVVRGDSRPLQVTLRESGTLVPVDLTSADVMVCFPKDGGGSIKRRSYPLSITPVSANSTRLSALNVPSHGFISNDLVTVAASDGATLPAGLTAGMLYTIAAIDNDTLGFCMLDGTPVVLSDMGQGVMSIFLQLSCTVSQPNTGNIDLTLSVATTQAMSVGQGQPVEVTLSSGNSIRIIQSPNSLDVVDQVYT